MSVTVNNLPKQVFLTASVTLCCEAIFVTASVNRK